ncbi:MAG: VCBS repeat-containing protein [Bacteroidota bacterium]
MHDLVQRTLLMACLVAAAGCQTGPAPYTWTEAEGYRSAPIAPTGGGQPGFAERQTAIDDANVVSDSVFLANRHVVNGAGLALADVDGDGWTDVYLARLEGDNTLYRNLGGWQFEDITAQAGVAAPDRYSTGATFADLDGDGDQDLLVAALGGPNAAYLNDGTGVFTEATTQLGLASNRGSMTQALADVDGDGDLDLYVANYRIATAKDIFPPDVRAFDRTVKQQGDDYVLVPPFDDYYQLSIQGNRLMRFEYGEPDAFYLNDGQGRFTAVPFTEGRFLNADGQPLTETPTDWALAARFQDINGDGHPDLYICNDFESPDYLWMNRGDGTFQAATTFDLRKISNSTMSVVMNDVNGDGRTDIFTADMLSRDPARQHRQMGTRVPFPAGVGEITNQPQEMQNMLMLQREDGTFAEVANWANVAASEWSWSTMFMDVDLDGNDDLLVTNGHRYDAMDSDMQQRLAGLPISDDWRSVLTLFPDLDVRNLAFRSKGGGQFEPVEGNWGMGASPDVTHGFVSGDLDGDGDLDLVANRLDAPPLVLENTASAGRVLVRLKGQAPNTAGIGAKIRVVVDGQFEQTDEIIAGGQYLSHSVPEAMFASGGADQVTIEVTWPDGTMSRIADVPTNHIYEIEQVGTQPAPTRTAPPATPLFAADEAFAHTHTETPFDDFARQPLLTRRLSQDGPAVAVVDLDGDGDDDLLVGSGRGGRVAMHRNDDGQLRAVPASQLGDLGAEASLDQQGILAIPDAAGQMTIFVASANYESEQRATSSIGVYQQQAGRWREVDRLDAGPSAVSALAAADIDSDGDLDVFAAGRFDPNAYPRAASSRLFVQAEGRWTFAAAQSAPFEDLGLVTGAVFGDMDSDGDVDLVTATEWGPVRIFRNDGAGQFAQMTASLGLDRYLGWWRGIDLGDFDGDGRLDIAAGNWGLNSRWEATTEDSRSTLRAWHGDVDVNGSYDVLEAYWNPDVDGFTTDRGLNTLGYGIPALQRRVPSHAAFAEQNVTQVLGPVLQNAEVAEVNTLEHAVFLNRGNTFERVALPAEAQWSSAQSIVVDDLDADGNEDLFLSQNWFAVHLETPRLDAGRGLWLQGNGQGSFTPWTGSDSGVTVYGEQRAAATADFDGDGLRDVVVTQNGNATRLYRGTSAQPVGLTVKFDGTPPVAGTTLHLRYADGTEGPRRLIRIGSGWLSQQSTTQRLGFAEDTNPAEALVVTPPGADPITAPLTAEQTQVVINIGILG